MPSVNTAEAIIEKKVSKMYVVPGRIDAFGKFLDGIIGVICIVYIVGCFGVKVATFIRQKRGKK